MGHPLQRRLVTATQTALALLLLALPAVPMHSREECQHSGNEFGNGADAEVPQRENPFAALGDLLKADSKKDSAEKD